MHITVYLYQAQVTDTNTSSETKEMCGIFVYMLETKLHFYSTKSMI